MNTKALVLGTVKKDFDNEQGKNIEYYQLNTYISKSSVTFKTTKDVYEQLKDIGDEPQNMQLTLEFEDNGRAKVITAK